MPFTQQQLVDAYDQMTKDRQDDSQFAQVAADKLGQIAGLAGNVQAVDDAWHWSHGAVTPYTTNHVLTIQLCQYDDWQKTVADLQAAGVQMKPWGGTYNPGPEGNFDLSADPTFAGRSKQSYTVKIVYYDSHSGGY